MLNGPIAIALTCGIGVGLVGALSAWFRGLRQLHRGPRWLRLAPEMLIAGALLISWLCNALPLNQEVWTAALTNPIFLVVVAWLALSSLLSTHSEGDDGAGLLPWLALLFGTFPTALALLPRVPSLRDRLRLASALASLSAASPLTHPALLLTQPAADFYWQTLPFTLFGLALTAPDWRWPSMRLAKLVIISSLCALIYPTAGLAVACLGALAYSKPTSNQRAPLRWGLAIAALLISLQLSGATSEIAIAFDQLQTLSPYALVAVGAALSLIPDPALVGAALGQSHHLQGLPPAQLHAILKGLCLSPLPFLLVALIGRPAKAT